MEDAGGEHGVGFAGIENVDHVIKISRSSAGDHRNRDGLTDGSRQFDVVTGLGAVGIHTGQ